MELGIYPFLARKYDGIFLFLKYGKKWGLRNTRKKYEQFSINDMHCDLIMTSISETFFNENK